MILYVNGNEHYAAAYAAVNAMHADDDIDLWWMGNVGHPKNIEVSFGRVLSRVLKARPVIEAKRHSTDADIIEATKKFVTENPVKEQIVAIVALDQFDDAQVQELATFFKENNVKFIIHPHADYIKWMQDHEHAANEFGYYGQDAQKAWAANLIKPLTKIL